MTAGEYLATGVLLRHIRKIKRVSDRFASFLSRHEAAVSDGGFSDNSSDKTAKNAQKIMTELLRFVDIMYAEIGDFECDFADETGILLSDYGVCDRMLKGVELRVAEDCLILKTPHLISRNQRFTAAANGAFSKDHSAVFQREVAEKMKDAPPRFKSLLNKTILCVFVYAPNRQYIPDADNLDTKTVIDAITAEMYGGDSGDCCSFIKTAIRSDVIQEGSFFLVYSGKDRAVSPSEYCATLSSYFQKYDP